MNKISKVLVGTLLVLPLSAFADITGDWEIESSVGGTIPITVNCSLVQTGDDVGGTCTPVMENPEAAEVTGSASASSAEWGYDVVFNGNPGTVAFAADEVSANEMSGTLNLSGSPAPFTATRK